MVARDCHAVGHVTNLNPYVKPTILRRKMLSRSLSFFSCFVLLSILGNGDSLQSLNSKYLNSAWIIKTPRPTVPAWPDQFTSNFYVYVEAYGEDFRADGAVFYDWTKQVRI